ncbi:hypothetical protein [Bacillus toyonensis]|nr:hypothetical protein [Bacillus toyonensis]MDF9450951.1 hypothetical protein [Bacillus toyonensis]MDG1564754.1 hypothetical protein [Bacillus toyonensis]
MKFTRNLTQSILFTINSATCGILGNMVFAWYNAVKEADSSLRS